MSEDEGMEELVTEEMLWDRIPEVEGEERASTYYELSARENQSAPLANLRS